MPTQLLESSDPWAPDRSRVGSVRHLDASAPDRVDRLTDLALRGLASGYDADTGSFAQTVRGLADGRHVSAEAQGLSLRYTAMATLGLSRVPLETQCDVLAGRTAADVALQAVDRAVATSDPGAVALAVWAAIEVAGVVPDELLTRLRGFLDERRPLPTVDAAWLLTAATEATRLSGDGADLVKRAADFLGPFQGPGGLYPHLLPPREQSRWRAHVGSFADQVYPLQAFARAVFVTGEDWMLEQAERTAAAICAAQGPAGQWWWHYDSRGRGIVERYPVYSVHQHAMAPMVLFDLWAAGGTDRRPEIVAGLSWVDEHPEVVEELVAERFGLVWRKVGRREPRKAARALGAATTAVWPGVSVPGVDRVLPPVVVDHECRPYELGWLLYAWLSPAPYATALDTTEVSDA